MKNMTFKKQKLAATISLLLGTSAVTPAYAEEAEQLVTDKDKSERVEEQKQSSAPTPESEIDELDEEEHSNIIQITGIRGSLLRSMDMKRDAIGVMDAISAEEMGKFPDTNLAESLQRITGVTASRANGEGSQITVRGFGPSFNLMTLNGRQMPGTGNTRSFNLENLSSEGVSALEVFKTARAEKPSGGLGATVNIVTTKPLDSPKLKYSISAKGINDTSNEKGDDVTPELAALYSNAFLDETFGVAISVSHQERDFQQQSAQVDGWLANQSLGNASGDDAIDNRPRDANGDPIGNVFLPRNMGYSIADIERERTNGQLTLQYAPTDNLVATLDYTVSEAETANESLAFGVWFNFGGNINSYELDERGTAIRLNEANNDYAHTARKATTLVEAESVGFNLEWQLNGDTRLEFDFHDSDNTIDFGADDGSGSAPFVIIAPNNLEAKEYDFSSGDIPQIELFWPTGIDEARPQDFDPLFARFDTSGGKSEIKQFQLHGEWLNPGNSSWVGVKFGAAFTDQTIGGYGAGNDQQGPNGYNGNMAIFPDSMFTRHDTGSFLDQLAGGGNNLITNYYYTYDFDEAISRMAAFFPGFLTDPFATGGIDSITSVDEETSSLYLQTGFQFDWYDMPVDLNVGIRYEETDVSSRVKQRVEQEIVWVNPTEWNLRFSESDGSFVTTKGSYDLLLPNLDLSVEITDDLVARFSAGKTITRAPLGNLAGIRSLSANPKPGSRNGSAGNTDLEPFESTNIDISFEYYYDEGSYVALGYFNKDVKNFISTSFETITVDGLRDPFIGPRREEAEAQVIARGEQPTLTAIFEQIIANGGGNAEGQVVQNADDPLVEWLVSQPTNGESKEVDGIEFAIQHLFGESGFGGAINATFVDGDVEFDRDSLDVQSPLNGLSDSANLQGFYEKDGLSVKLTYTWRDEYLIGIGQAQGSADAPPQFSKAYEQWDLSVNYDITDELVVFFEGINLLDATEESFGRYREQFLSARQYGPRYTLGARYTF